MGFFYVYSIKVAVCLTAFYLFYKLLMSRETLHRLNRCTLLGVIFVSLALPFVRLHTAEPTVVGSVVGDVELIIADAVVADEGKSAGLSLVQTLFLIYIIGVVVFTVRELWSLIGLRLLMRRGRKESTADGLNLIIVDEDISPFSWFGNIIISRKDYEGQSREILLHEREHARLRHSADILLCDALIIFQWYNPSAWLLKRELQAVHEYEADEAVLRCGVCAADYQLLLIRKAVGERMFSLANNLNQCSIKKRITMMMTKKSSKTRGFKLLLAVPVAACAVAAFANPEVESVSNEWAAEGDNLMANVRRTTNNSEVGKQEDETLGSFMEGLLSGIAEKDERQAKETTAEVSDNVSKADSADNRECFSVPQKLPEFPGGPAAMMTYISKEMHYPEAAIKANEQGRVVVKFTVEKDGTICEPKVLRSVSATLDAEALRLVSGMPKWTPGQENGKAVRCQFAMPIKFSLGGDGTELTNGKTVESFAATTVVTKDGKTVNNAHIYVLDGKRITEAELKKVKPETIESMTVLNGKAATDKYGEDGKYGVVEITTKK